MKSIFFLITAIVITQLVSAQDWDELNNLQEYLEKSKLVANSNLLEE